MIITYEEFCERLLRVIHNGEDFYDELLKTVIDNPARYCGLFRLSNAKTKLIQNVTQSNEIKFGDLVEEMVTEYIARLGYKNLPKCLGVNENGDELNVDQHFTDGNIIYMVEMKIRDDHDSTKKRGQFNNFVLKINRLKQLHPNKVIFAFMWFVDDALHKNKNYYQERMDEETIDGCAMNLYYGYEFFYTLNGGEEAWDEFLGILRRYRQSNTDYMIMVADFGTSIEILNALVRLPSNYWRKLNSNTTIYIQLRNELFSSGDNIDKAERIRIQNGLR